jgi:hypothetical protein
MDAGEVFLQLPRRRSLSGFMDYLAEKLEVFPSFHELTLRASTKISNCPGFGSLGRPLPW